MIAPTVYWHARALHEKDTAQAMTQLKLFELAGADPELRFSPYCWKVRMALAHKGLQADGVPWRFTDTDDIAFSGQKLVPVLVDGKQSIHDSWTIALYLEEHFPERPSLFGSDSAIPLALFINSWADSKLAPALSPILLPDIFDRIHEKDRAYFRETREKRFGRLEDLTPKRAAYLEALKQTLQPLRVMLKKQAFIAGTKPAYADYAVFGMFMWARCTSDISLLDADDPVYDWRERMLDAFDAMARRAPCVSL